MGRNYWLTVVSSKRTKTIVSKSISFFQIPVSSGSRDFLLLQITLTKQLVSRQLTNYKQSKT
jgi:hypothetical protein